MYVDIIKTIDQLEEGMKVEIKKGRLKNAIRATVSEVEYEGRQGVIGHNPLRIRIVKRATLLCDGGKKVTITQENFDEFKIRRK